MENKIIPTAEEFLWNGGIITQGDTEPYGKLPNDKIPSVMIEFAKLHVEAALENVLENMPYLGSTDTVSYSQIKEAVLNSYSLENIK